MVLCPHHLARAQGQGTDKRWLAESGNDDRVQLMTSRCKPTTAWLGGQLDEHIAASLQNQAQDMELSGMSCGQVFQGRPNFIRGLELGEAF